MGVNKGNHVIMLEVSVPERLVDAAREWVKGNATDRQLHMEKPHVTLLFIGKDLPVEAQEAFTDAAAYVAGHIKALAGINLLSTGKWSMFGGNKDHLVMNVQGSPPLLDVKKVARDFVVDAYWNRTGEKLDVKGDHGVYRPHVTLATGPGHAFAQNVPGVVFPVTGVYVKTGDGNKFTYEV